MRMRSPAIFLRTRARQMVVTSVVLAVFLMDPKQLCQQTLPQVLLLPGGVEMSAVRLIR